MELFQDLTIKLNPNYPGFQQTLLELVEQSSVWKIRKDYQEAFLQRGLLKDRTVICIETPVWVMVERISRLLSGLMTMVHGYRRSTLYRLTRID